MCWYRQIVCGLPDDAERINLRYVRRSRVSILLHALSAALKSVRHSSKVRIQRVILILTLLLLLLSAKLLHVLHAHLHAHATTRSLLLLRLTHLHTQLVLHSLQVLNVLLIANASTILLLLFLRLRLMRKHLLEIWRKAGNDLRRRLTAVFLEQCL